MDFNTLEIIGLAFLAGLNIAEITENVMDEEETEKAGCEGKHCKFEQEDIKAKAEDKIEKVEIKKVTQEEMGKILDDLKNKILGGK